MQAAGKRYIIHNSRSDRFRIWNLADLHEGNVGCAEKELDADIRTIRDDPHSFWLGGGDYADFIGYHDKRFDPDAVAEWVTVKKLGDLGKASIERVRDKLKPIAGKCLGLLIGNHELKYQLAMEHESLHAWLCTELGVPSLGYSCIFDVVFIRSGSVKQPRLSMTLRPGGHTKTHANSFRVFAHHGAGYAQTPGGKLNRLVGFMQAFEADLYFVGHVHDHLARKEPVLTVDASATKIVQRERLGVIAGSYLKTYQQGATTYGEQRGYRPTSLGAAVAEVHPETREMKAAI